MDGNGIQVGDTVVVYINIKNLYSQVVEQDKVFQTKYGALKHNDLIGRPFGTKVSCTRGYVYVLRLTPELWTATLPHRTQILYQHDCSLIVAGLDLRPGSKVVEAGTGSGSLSHMIARAVYPHGHLFTFDFHEQRVQLASDEFRAHGIGDSVTVHHEDVCKNGFKSARDADALFLDVPHPWEAIGFAHDSLKSKGGRICCFSPCIEQVQRTVAALRENKFVDVNTVECVRRPYEVKTTSVAEFHFDSAQELPDANHEVDTDSQPTQKKVKTTNGPDEDGSAAEGSPVEGKPKTKSKFEKQVKEFCTASPMINIAGHTGFLTFATSHS